MNRRVQTLCVSEILLLLVSVVAFAALFSESLSFVSAASLQELGLSSDADLTPLGNNRFAHPNGNVYVKQGQEYVLERSATTNTNSVTNTNNPSTSPPTNPSTIQQNPTPNPFAQTAGASAAAAGAGGGGLYALTTSIGQLGSILTGPLGEALVWGGVIFGATLAVSSVFGGSGAFVEAISIAAGLGTFAGKLSSGLFGLDTVQSILVGTGVGFVTFLLLYEDVKYEAVEFHCLPWQAPLGSTSDTCETCNDDTMPCSEYRCRSLGATCELVNKGTREELCVDVNPKDVVPPTITPDSRELSVGYTYTDVRLSPPGPGFVIERTSGSNPCIEAFTPLRFGVTTDEPAQCKIDFNSTDSFDAMYTFMGGNNLFVYDHYEQFVLPHAKDLGNSTLQLQNGQDLTFFIRCRDRRGNENEAEYAVSFCVDPSPDTTAPQIQLTSVADAACIPATTDSAVIDFYVNEPSQCRFSREDQDFDSMQGVMQCSTQLFQMNALQLYTCTANLTGITRELTDFYVRCRDQPNEPNINDRNTNQQSYRFSLRGSNQLKLQSVGPNGTIAGGINPMPVDLEVETLFGCDRGVAQCYFSSELDGNYILFGTTNTQDGIHNQTLYLGAGNHDYFVKCVDSGGNLVTATTSFTLDIDTSAPIIARIYNDAGQLKIVTQRDSECSYTTNNCDFLFEEGIVMPKVESQVHFAPWNNDDTYYVKCRDRFRDLTADCSAIIKPTQLLV